MTQIGNSAFGVTTGSSDTDMITASGDAAIRLQALEVAALGTACTIKIRSLSTGSTVGTYLLGSTGHGIKLDPTGVDGAPGFVLPFNERGWGQTKTGDKLAMHNSTSQALQYNATFEYVGSTS